VISGLSKGDFHEHFVWRRVSPDAAEGCSGGRSDAERQGLDGVYAIPCPAVLSRSRPRTQSNSGARFRCRSSSWIGSLFTFKSIIDGREEERILTRDTLRRTPTVNKVVVSAVCDLTCQKLVASIRGGVGVPFTPSRLVGRHGRVDESAPEYVRGNVDWGAGPRAVART